MKRWFSWMPLADRWLEGWQGPSPLVILCGGLTVEAGAARGCTKCKSVMAYESSVAGTVRRWLS